MSDRRSIREGDEERYTSDMAQRDKSITRTVEGERETAQGERIREKRRHKRLRAGTSRRKRGVWKDNTRGKGREHTRKGKEKEQRGGEKKKEKEGEESRIRRSKQRRKRGRKVRENSDRQQDDLTTGRARD